MTTATTPKSLNGCTTVDLDQSRCVWDNGVDGDARIELWADADNVHVWAETNGDPVYGEDALRRCLTDEGMAAATVDQIVEGDFSAIECEDCEQQLIEEDDGRCRACEPYEIEYCTNDEWLVVFGPCDPDPESDASEPSIEARDLLFRELCEVEGIEGVQVVGAKRGRCLCHGWNGAQFAWRQGQFGSFETLPAMLRQQLEETIEAVTAATNS